MKSVSSDYRQKEISFLTVEKKGKTMGKRKRIKMARRDELK